VESRAGDGEGNHKSGSVRVFIVRHGEYDGKLVQGMAGLLDPQLNDRGLAAAQRVGDLLASEPVAILMFSPLLRTMQTGELIARPHKAWGLVPEINHGLAAVNRGDWSGLTPQQVEEHFPGDLRTWSMEHDFKEHGGESFNELLSRTRVVLGHILALAREKLRKSNGSIAVCIVGHSSTVASVLSLVRPGPPSGEQWLADSLRIGYCSVTLVEFAATADAGGLAGNVLYVGKVVEGGTETTKDASRSVTATHPSPTLPGSSPGLATQRDLEHGPALRARPELPSVRAGSGPKLGLRSSISIVTLPSEISPDHEIETRIVVLIDALRMSSALVTAMGHGLESAQLFSSVMEVTHAVRDYGSCALLGGEQKRVLIPGFDRDNSPRSYLDGVSEKRALFLTTNGTRALPWVRKAKMLVLGSFLNASAVVRTILAHLADVGGVVLLCSGTERGTVRSEDDELCAGYLLKTLLASHPSPPSLCLDDVAVSILQKTYELDSWNAVREAFSKTPAAAALREIQLGDDVDFCSQRDRYEDVLPFYFRESDTFFSHRVHYDIPVSYEFSGNQRRMLDNVPVDAEAALPVQVYIVAQDDDADAPGIASAAAWRRITEMERLCSELSRGFAWIDIGVLACSPAHSCRVAAEAIAQGRLFAEIYSGLSMVSCGDWAGLSLAEVGELYPEGLRSWRMDHDWKNHGGESLREVHERAAHTFGMLLTSYLARVCSGALVIVTHRDLARSMVLATRRLSLEAIAAAWGSAATGPDAGAEVMDVLAPPVTLLEVVVPSAVRAGRQSMWDGCTFQVRGVGASAPVLDAAGVAPVDAVGDLGRKAAPTAGGIVGVSRL